MVISFIMAGRDTTSAAMTWLFWSLSRHPNSEKDVVKEVVTTLGNNGQKSLDYEALKDLPLFKACLSDGLVLEALPHPRNAPKRKRQNCRKRQKAGSE
uniref:Uncharacterized protein n=1 Tax=Nelumbo nucifera TaxID=4432 RepID=A0A822XTF4_NELNU|nr:TPA_asm: hypothetical protein HUJ06_026358 [Nelumbo nucifera]